MRLAATLGGVVLGFLLTVLSLPWVIYAMGRAMVGDDEGADRALEAAPLCRYWDWTEARRVRL